MFKVHRSTSLRYGQIKGLKWYQLIFISLSFTCVVQCSGILPSLTETLTTLDLHDPIEREIIFLVVLTKDSDLGHLPIHEQSVQLEGRRTTLGQDQPCAQFWSQDTVSLIPSPPAPPKKKAESEEGLLHNKIGLQSDTLLLRGPAASPPLTTHSPNL